MFPLKLRSIKKMNSFSKLLFFLISYELFLSLAACLVIWGGAALYFLKMEPWDAVNILPVKTLLVLIFMNRLSGSIYEGAKGKRTVLLSAGIIVLLSGFLVNYLYRFEGVMHLGEGENFTEYESRKRGLMARPLDIPLVMEKVEADPFNLEKGAKAEIYDLMNKKNAVFNIGQYRKWNSGVSVGVMSVDLAPRILIEDKERELFSAFYKINLYPKGNIDHFTVIAPPHRFYLSLTKKDDKPFNLKILSGKLVVVNQDLALGEKVKLDWLDISIPETAYWAEIHVKYYPGNMIMYLGLICVLAGIVMIYIPAGAKK